MAPMREAVKEARRLKSIKNKVQEVDPIFKGGEENPVLLETLKRARTRKEEKIAADGQ